MKRLSILDSISTTLANISPGINYFSDLGGSFEYWANTEAEYDRQKLTFRDGEEEIFKNNICHEKSLLVEIEAIKFTDDPKIVGCYILADILKAIGSNLNWDGNAISTNLINNTKEVVTEGKTAVRVTVTIEILYRTELWQA